MGAPGMKFIFLGLAILLVGFFFKDNLKDMGSGYFMGAEILGALVVLFGAFLFFKAKNSSQTAGSEGHVQLRNEILLNTLARLTYADSNTKAIEVEAVRKIYKRETGENVTAAEIRVAARGDLHEALAFDKYLSKGGAKLSSEDKCFIMKAMAEIVKSDGSVSPGEVDFFDGVGKAFKMSASEVAELRK